MSNLEMTLANLCNIMDILSRVTAQEPEDIERIEDGKDLIQHLIRSVALQLDEDGNEN
jgi:hypothetical protein